MTNPLSPGTANPEEVARFTAMAETWWDPDGKFGPLHKFNPTRLTFIRDRAAARFGRDPLDGAPLKGLRILDIGCGGGLLCEPLSRMGAEVTGIDAGDKNVGIAAAHAEQMGLDITYRHAMPEDLVAEGLQFDLVTNMEVIEHVDDPDLFLAHSCALVRPGGAMAMATMNRTLKSLALGKIGAEYILRWLPAGTHDWRKFVRPSELARGLRPHGLLIEALKGMSFHPMSARWDLSDDLDVNYLAFCIKD
ncbi:bifunctional 2-polyprenyl-6-hydroxyphenol methylase/3-demethylubiquinol 3-O-methyltransferase UbiG [Magnetospira sp. QH-2]|uniref:bifunctional 2-polyprenyl-6-hydroxyphenol methylase/3-demethylubiquinol 3-O-methyltransferase UbiG n=1 Tax=Magnetospira sp. (strain QH-2) TaxID=1288970 RepID=UPI0003E80F65|nr:bifunctional 2-polyprenyl-6-hydroxyphenol methylase/3-demethylubiquinol 3-O-methyltransferase UbiG [Magnetospira sp. QH-2]CCQ73185.1 3-demethylubiquinone-9 3-O-methyltransferase [Magnetospira sp. QH-2]